MLLRLLHHTADKRGQSLGNMQLPVLSAQYLWLRWIFGAVCAAVSLSFYRYVHYYVLTYFCDFIEGEKI